MSGVRGFLGRLVLRANWAVVSWVLRAAAKRWFTTLLILWALWREVVPSQRSSLSLNSAVNTKEKHALAPVVGGATGSNTKQTSSPAPYPTATDLVLVCGHAVFVGSDYGNANDESSWFLEEYQKTPGQADALINHMKRGVELVAKNENALLVFSGGTTRKNAGSVSEASSYWQVARANKWWGFGEDDGDGNNGIQKRAFTEEHARDSYENVVFSIARFRELTGRIPQSVTVVGYEFKRQRFEVNHLCALRYPANQFKYEGLPAASLERETQSEISEITVRKQFEKDPYGCVGVLGNKRQERDPFKTGQPYVLSNPDLANLFNHCDGEKTFDGELPW